MSVDVHTVIKKNDPFRSFIDHFIVLVVAVVAAVYGMSHSCDCRDGDVTDWGNRLSY